MLSFLVATAVGLAYLAVPVVYAPQIWASLRWVTASPLSYAVGMWLLQWATILLGNGLFLALYLLRLPVFERHRVLKTPWPWRSPKAAVRTAFWSAFRQAVLRTVFNSTLVSGPAAYFTYAFVVRPETISDATLPSLTTFAWQLAVFVLLDDISFYAGHRLLHDWSLAYRHIHKEHHAWPHTTTAAVMHLHPVEFALCNLLPVALGPAVCDAHLFTTIFWFHLRLMQTIEAHSNYAFPWSPCVAWGVNGAGVAHEAHHSINTGNYGSFTTVWDSLFGTKISDAVVARRTAAGPEEEEAAAAAKADE